jgi:hypothetical protein
VEWVRGKCDKKEKQKGGDRRELSYLSVPIDGILNSENQVYHGSISAAH